LIHHFERVSLRACLGVVCGFGYRDDALGAFAPAELEKLLSVAPLLRQVHQNVLRAVPPAPNPVYALNQA